MSENSSPPVGVGTPIVAVVAQVTFLLALIASGFLAWQTGTYDLLLTLAGASAINATTVVNYYLGSSSGSAKKTELLAQPRDTIPPKPEPPGGNVP